MTDPSSQQSSDPIPSSDPQLPPEPDVENPFREFNILGVIPQCIFADKGPTIGPYCGTILPIGEGDAVKCERCHTIAGIPLDEDEEVAGDGD